MQWHCHLCYVSLKSIKLLVLSIQSVLQIHNYSVSHVSLGNIIRLFSPRIVTDAVLYLKYILIFGVLLELKVCLIFLIL